MSDTSEPYFIRFRENCFSNSTGDKEKKNQLFKPLPPQIIYNDKNMVDYWKTQGVDYSMEFAK